MLSSIISAFLQGGIWMWLILFLQVISLAIVIERVVFLYFKSKVGQKEYAGQFEASLVKGDFSAALSKREEGYYLNESLEAGVQVAQSLGGREAIRGKMDEILLIQNQGFEKRIGFLAMLANVGTLTGLLGTIVGMIKSFTAVTYGNPADKATLLSQGISEAMNTTAYGLIMAIPALIMFAVLTSRSSDLCEDLNQGALKVYNWLGFSYDPLAKNKA